MFDHNLYIQSPANPGEIQRGLLTTASATDFDRILVAVAYATETGARVLVDLLEERLPQWESMTKQWLLSIDDGFTRPVLDRPRPRQRGKRRGIDPRCAVMDQLLASRLKFARWLRFSSPYSRDEALVRYSSCRVEIRVVWPADEPGKRPTFDKARQSRDMAA